MKSNFFVSIGASKGIEECQNQFQDRHWNCSIYRDGSVFGPVLYHGKSSIDIFKEILNLSVFFS